VLFENYP